MGLNMYFGFVVLCLVCFIKINESLPIISEQYNFEDDWDYNTLPHSIPLLNETTRNHILPVFLKKSSEKEGGFSIKNQEIRKGKKIGDAVKVRVPCSACKLGVGLMMKEIKHGTPFKDIEKKFVSLCVSLKIENELVCTGIFEVYGPEVVPALNTTEMGAKEICGLVLGETCGDVEIPLHEWTVELPDKIKPESSKRDLPKDGLPTFKVLHLSDTHYDPEYVEGSPANCDEPLCCRAYSTPSSKDTLVQAGKWGSYGKCDSPKSLIFNMLRNIAAEHPDIDYIIWTGDLPPHDIWNQTKESNLDIIQDTVDQMFEVFPNTPIFPALGNHEAAPAGNFAPPWMADKDHSVSWLYTKVADQWRRWLPATAGGTLLHGGFYSVLIRPGFRLISLNTNYCHALSWWLLVNSTDPAKELKWLVHELQEAEDKGELVHLIGHIPPGSWDCMKVWSRNFNSIVERYEDTIVAQFYGHSHADEFQVFYDTNEYSKKLPKIGRLFRRWWFWYKNKEQFNFTGRPTSIAYLGPSVTTFNNYNPAFRFYYVDGDHENSTREVLDHETWTTDLQEANEAGNDPIWYRLYSARNEYNMESLRPLEWSRLIDRMVDDPDIFNIFYKNYYRDSPTRPPCDSNCKLQLLCDLRSAKSHDKHTLCHDLELTIGS